jgi:hypothetical protein
MLKKDIERDIGRCIGWYIGYCIVMAKNTVLKIADGHPKAPVHFILV